MSACEKCWRDSRTADDSVTEYHRLVALQRCTPEEQAGPDATQCPVCKRMTLHQHTLEPMCSCPEPGRTASPSADGSTLRASHSDLPAEDQWAPTERERQLLREATNTIPAAPVASDVATAKVCPREPTWKMIEAARSIMQGVRLKDYSFTRAAMEAWQAMHDAAPLLPVATEPTTSQLLADPKLVATEPDTVRLDWLIDNATIFAPDKEMTVYMCHHPIGSCQRSDELAALRAERDRAVAALRELVQLRDELREHAKVQAKAMNPFGPGLTDDLMRQIDQLTRGRSEREKAAWSAARTAIGE